MIKDEGTRFLNVDLDIIARVPLDDMVEAFGEKALVLHVGRRGRLYYVYLETADSYRNNADQIIQKLVSMIKRLPRNARRTWDQAKSREFNIGIEAAHKSPIYFLQLKQKTLEDVMSVGGTIAFTVYPPEMPTKKQMVRVKAKPRRTQSKKN